jgi:ABC-type glycerol-3-phosphate transport system substrate-binding protein
MRRRVFLSAAAAAALAVGLAGCGSATPQGNSAGNDGTTVQVLSNFTPDVARGKVLDKLIKQFNAAHKGEYTVVSKSQPDWPTLQQQIRSSISAGSPADVFLYNYNPTDLSREKSGKLMDWSKYLDADSSWKARFKAANLQSLTVSGQTVALPADQSPALIYYNKALFAKAGITTFPTTWDGFITTAQKLKAKGIPAIALQTADDAWYSMNALSYSALAHGGADATAVGSNLDSAAIKSSAADVQKLLTDYAPKDAVGGNYAAASADFLGGRAAMVIDGPWLISSVQSKMSDPDQVGVAAGPTATGGAAAGSIVTDSLNAWGAAKQTDPKKTKAVVAWMKFFTSNSSAAAMAVDGQYPMAVQTTLTDAEKAKAPSQMASFLDIANTAPVAVVSAGRNLNSSTQAALPAMLESMALGRTSPSAFAAQLQKSNSTK